MNKDSEAEADLFVRSLVSQEEILPLAELKQHLAKLREFADKLKNRKYEAWALQSEAISHLRFGDINDAFKLVNEAADIFQSLNDNFGLAYSLILVGSIQYYKGKLTDVLATQMKALEAAKASGNVRIEGGAYLNIGTAYGELGNIPEALRYFELALKNRLDAGDKKRAALIYNNMASIQTTQGNYPKALENYYLSKSIREELDDQIGLAETHTSLGVLYRMQGNLDEALKNYEVSLEYNLVLEAKNEIAFSLNYVGSIYLDQGRLDEAEINFQKALPIFKERDELKGMVLCYTNLGDLASARGRNAEALDFYTLAQSLNDKTGYKEGNLKLIMAKAKVHAAMGEHAEAIALLKAADQLACEIENKVAQKDCALTLAEVYKVQNDYESAFRSFRIYHELSTSLLNEQTTKQVNQLNFQHNMEQKEKMLETEAEKNKMLEEKNRMIEQALAEREVLLKEIHHRVKNNLQVISSLLELQSAGIDDEQAKAAISEGQNRVRSIALIHNKLYQNEDMASIELKDFVEELYRQVGAVFLTRDQVVETRFDIEPTYLDIDTAVPLGLILNELITNAFKYAFDKTKKGLLLFSLNKLDAGRYELTVRDNGKGLPENFDLKKATSLGLRLIRRLSKQAGGSTEYRYDSGSIFTINFKDTETRKLKD